MTTRFLRAAVLAFFAAGGMVALAAGVSAQKEKEKEAKGELLKTVTDATAEYTKDGKLMITATGQVPTGGWKDAKLTPKAAKEAPKDGIYEFELTAVRPDGIVPQVISKVKAEYTWEKVPADVKGVKILGDEKGAKTVKVEKK